ncbi:uncharacterized protein LOC103816685 isoform X4 [Serinus canaria]|uniref:uncharacterized protein LOC103816685 isoform X4 n=1 Tax=Serinus canaria TaxID=9135 RepID=UPI0021CCFFD3|nr:uncharacterized protein LOC103816685 isoform X4 [Serinus canaria]
MGAQSHTLGCAGLLFTPSRRQPCHVSPPGAEAGDMAALARSVLVTGSNRGIGLELVRQLAASPQPPQHIFATCRDPEGPGGKALQELAAQHSSIKLVQLDTVNLSSIQSAMQTVGNHLKDRGLNLLINNAGISSHATLCSLDSQEMLDVFATNVVGPLQVVKAAQNMVTRCLAVELQDKGILCMAIHPGWVKTDMGTQEAPLPVEHSVRGILTVLASLSQDTSGAFLDWEGNSLPW